MPTITLAPPEAGDRSATPGDRIGDRYRIVREIGRGGMGEVVAAFDEHMSREVAIKRPRTRTPSERAIARLLREAQIQGGLEHPAIVPVHEIGHDGDGLPYFVMKKLAGTTLRQILGAPTIPRQRLLRAFADVCLAIELAHGRGIVHRDLKPENIMLGELGEVYVLDWGVAALAGEPDPEAAIGTPGYMPPEPTADGRADIYALGCILFEILSGDPLHPDGERVPADRDARPSQRAPDRQIPPELDALCVAATCFDAAHRLASARALGEGVQSYLDGDRDLALRQRLAREHLERARRAYAGDRDTDRSDAMRAAAAALALDPALGDAAALVGRLMLDPPRATPRAVAAAVRTEDIRMVRANVHGAIAVLAVTLVMMPLVWWISPPGSAYFRALLGVLAAGLVIVTVAARARIPRPGLVVLANALILAVASRMCSPLLVAPGLAAVLGVAVAVWPRLGWTSSAVTIAVANIAAVFVPWACEWFGLASPTISVDHDAIVFHAPGLAGTTGSIVAVGAIYATALIAAACVIGAAMRARHAAAHEALQLQAWQLRQLVPA